MNKVSFQGEHGAYSESAGKRFFDAGYIFPKPIIEIKNKPMIQWVIDSLKINENYIFIIQKELLFRDKYEQVCIHIRWGHSVKYHELQKTEERTGMSMLFILNPFAPDMGDLYL